MRCRSRTAFSLASAFTVLALASPAASSDDLVVGNYVLVSSQRVTRVDFEYTFQADVTNLGTANLQSVAATVTSQSPYTVVVDADLAFGEVASGQTVPSTDTFTVRQNRMYPFDWGNLSWTVQGEAAGASPLVVGPDGGTLDFPNGVVLQIPPGAVLEPTAIEVSDVSLGEAWEVISASEPQEFVGLLGGFSGKPDGLRFQTPVIATIPLDPPLPGTVPIPVELDLSAQTWRVSTGALVYHGERRVAEVAISHFSETVVAAKWLVEKLAPLDDRWQSFDSFLQECESCSSFDSPSCVLAATPANACCNIPATRL